MLCIAIVDSTDECYTLENTLDKVCKELYVEKKIEHFYKADDLCETLRTGRSFDVIFLGIDIHNVGGMQAASFIRDDYGDEMQQIVFLSDRRSQSMKLHKYHPLDFLIKPISADDFRNVIIKLLKIREKGEGSYSYHVGREYEVVKVNDIRYLTVSNRVVRVVLKNNKTIDHYGTLGKVYYEQLKKYGFLYVHKRYIINPKYIKDFEYDRVLLEGGDVIPIGSSRRREMRAYRLIYAE